MKRYIALFLLAAIAAGIISCGNEGGTSQTDTKNDTKNDTTTAATETEADIYDKLRGIDLGGYEFNILTYDRASWDIYIAPEDETGDVLNDAAYQRNREVEELLNVRITA